MYVCSFTFGPLLVRADLRAWGGSASDEHHRMTLQITAPSGEVATKTIDFPAVGATAEDAARVGLLFALSYFHWYIPTPAFEFAHSGALDADDFDRAAQFVGTRLAEQASILSGVGIQ
jgi:hypothetical protein